MLKNKYNIATVLVFLIIVFIIVISLTGFNNNEKTTLTNVNQESSKKTCQEMCKTDKCFYGCYTTLINIATAEKSTAKCNEINDNNIKQSCLDQVNLALKNCDRIINQNLKSLC